MGYTLEIAAAASVRSSASQAGIGTASALAVKVRVHGSSLLALPWYQVRDMVEIGDLGGTAGGLRTRVQIDYDPDASVPELVISALGPGYVVSLCAVPRDAISASEWYDLYVCLSAGQPDGAIANAAGTVLSTIRSHPSEGGINAAGTALGRVSLGDGPSTAQTGLAARYDGLAIYGAPLTGAARFGAPHRDDPGLLAYWPFDEGTGTWAANEVPGGVALDTWSGTVAWVAGGAWDGAPSGPDVRVWTGSAWVQVSAVRRWTGSAWQDVAVRRWTGSVWQDL
jgi:hypothetical protein